MAYEVVMSYHLHMPSYFLGTFTEYPYVWRGEEDRIVEFVSCVGYIIKKKATLFSKSCLLYE